MRKPCSLCEIPLDEHTPAQIRACVAKWEEMLGSPLPKPSSHGPGAVGERQQSHDEVYKCLNCGAHSTNPPHGPAEKPWSWWSCYRCGTHYRLDEARSDVPAVTESHSSLEDDPLVAAIATGLRATGCTTADRRSVPYLAARVASYVRKAGLSSAERAEHVKTVGFLTAACKQLHEALDKCLNLATLPPGPRREEDVQTLNEVHAVFLLYKSDDSQPTVITEYAPWPPPGLSDDTAGRGS